MTETSKDIFSGKMEFGDHFYAKLYHMISFGNIEEVEKVFSLYPDLDITQTNSGLTMLGAAVVSDDKEMIKLILSCKGINPNTLDKHHMAAMHIAADDSCLDAMSELLKSDAIDPNLKTTNNVVKATIRDYGKVSRKYGKTFEPQDLGFIPRGYDRGSTPLHIAVDSHNLEIIKVLLASPRVDVNALDGVGAPPICHAIYPNYPEMVRAFIENERVDVNITNAHKRTPLAMALELSEASVIAILMKCKDVKFDMRDSTEDTFLHTAAWNGNKVVVRELLTKEEIDINAQNCYGQTPLHLAACEKNYGIAKILLANKDILCDMRDNDGFTAIHYAMQGGCRTSAKLLLDYGVNSIQPDDEGMTPLYVASEEGFKYGVNLLLKNVKINPDNCGTHKGMTPLFIAAKNGHNDIVELLLKYNACDINAKDDDGLTTLMTAIQNEHVDIIRSLLEHKDIDLSVKDNKGNTASDIALKSNNSDIITLFQDANISNKIAA